MLTLHTCYQRTYQDTFHMERSKTKYHILIYISYGKINYWVNDDIVPLEDGDVLFIPAGSVRGGYSPLSDGHQRFATYFSSGGSEHLLPILQKNTYAKTKIQSVDYFKHRFSLLCHHWLMKNALQSTLCYAILLEMLGVMNYDLNHEKITTKKMKLVESIKNYLAAHYNEPIKLIDISEQIERTPTYITNIFKEVTGFSPIEYLHHVRIVKSKDLMFSTTKSMKEIADEIGFCDQAYFNRVFKKITGYSPSSFQRDARK